MSKMRTRLAGAVAIAAISTLALSACGMNSENSASGGEEFQPEGDVKMIVPFAAGGGSDIAGRATAAGLEEASGVNISVENQEGGSGAVGYSNFLAQNGNAEYLLASETALLALPLTQKVEFDYTSFTPIMKLGDDYTLLVVKEDSPYKTCSDLVNASKNERVVAAISGATGLDNIVFTLMEEKAGAKFDRVPFESGSEATTGLLGGKVDVISVNPGEITGQLEAGTVKPLCAAAEERYKYDSLKDIPTAKEQGIDVSFAQFRGVIAPGGISDEAKQYWIDAAKKFADSDAYTKYIEDNMMQPNVSYGDDFAAYLKSNNEDLKTVLGK
ncbi:tripartite tricarboxylate transporter substrate binding protein [Saxibacter everestensis]|uniref:Tripartite tricarboxylate transporter substrate binding protein n=1 Tax=Saxibacter everestensis TaxID=2909229 RepID=A0ABY8QW04_9MICO|nr:tripartite tricarboxylate transporter substrate binding protein [Brevibacteriaceae bacterium ZFBP1038]